MPFKKYIFSCCLFFAISCAVSNIETPNIEATTPSQQKVETIPKAEMVTTVSNFWKNASIYFLLTDRFNNGDTSNDFQYDRKQDGAVLRSFQGGDLKGITEKIKEGYFTKLGVDAIWMTPIVEQVHGHTDEGTGKTYAYHGYWTKDWTSLDPNFGTEADFAELMETAHQHGLRIMMDVVLNHTGPVTEIDPQWPDNWVRVDPTCTYTDFASTVECTLVDNLPDIKTESDAAVELPAFLKEKWRNEGRLEKELESLDAFFKRTGYPRAPKYYIVKWFRDWVRKYGVDGFRIDTAKHTEAGIWNDMKAECSAAFQEWKIANPAKAIDEEQFYMFGEVYNYYIDGGKNFDYGDRKVDFYANGFESLINFSFKGDATNSYESLFNKYSQILNGEEMKEVSVINYLTSHDDGNPFDKDRSKTYETATKLLLSPGAVQIYYGDETARPLIIEGTQGDATLRSFMNWEDLQTADAQDLLAHWQKLGQFRQAHLSIGAGKHEQLQAAPYLFKRTLDNQKDKVLVGLDLPKGEKSIAVFDVFEDGVTIKDAYSGKTAKVLSGKVELDTDFDIVLMEMYK